MNCSTPHAFGSEKFIMSHDQVTHYLKPRFHLKLPFAPLLLPSFPGALHLSGETPLDMVMQWCTRWVASGWISTFFKDDTTKTEPESEGPSQEQHPANKVKRRRPVVVNET